jgi:lysyl-tRNA synthetase class 2
MKPEKKIKVATDEEFIGLGIHPGLVPAIRELNIYTIEQLKGLNPNKLFNDICGKKKKLKLDAPNPSKEDVANWINA